MSFDTFVDDESEKDPDAMALEDAAKLEAEKLERYYSRCGICGPNKTCKIDRNGKHVHYTFQMIQSHAIGLVGDFCYLITP